MPGSRYQEWNIFGAKRYTNHIQTTAKDSHVYFGRIQYIKKIAR